MSSSSTAATPPPPPYSSLVPSQGPPVRKLENKKLTADSLPPPRARRRSAVDDPPPPPYESDASALSGSHKDTRRNEEHKLSTARKARQQEINTNKDQSILERQQALRAAAMARVKQVYTNTIPVQYIDQKVYNTILHFIVSERMSPSSWLKCE